MKKSLLFALGAGALGYFAYASGVFRKILSRPQKEVPVFDQQTGIRQESVTRDRQELAALKGIGAALAERIVENRPYLSKIDLVSRMIVPDSASFCNFRRTPCPDLLNTVHFRTHHPAIEHPFTVRVNGTKS